MPSPAKNISRTRVDINDRAEATFQILARYRYMPTRFLYALLPKHLQGDYSHFQNRLTKWSDKRFSLIAEPRQQYNVYNAHCKDNIYELGKNGTAYLKAAGLYPGYKVGNGDPYHHELLTCLVIASLEIECKQIAGVDFIPWSELITFDQVPTSTKLAENPFRIPNGKNKQGATTYTIPDGLPFLLRGNSKQFFFPGIETDMNTESLTGNARVTVEKKFKSYINIANNKMFKKHFGFDNMLVLFVFTSRQRMENAKKLLDKITKGRGCSFILFTYTDHLRSTRTSPDPVQLLPSDWDRVGKPSINLLEELNKKPH